MESQRRLPAAVDHLLAAISLVPRDEQEPAVRELREMAQAADRGEGEEQSRILQALRVLPQDGVELGIAIVCPGNCRPLLPGDLHPLEDRRLVEVLLLVRNGEGGKELEELAAARRESVLGDAVEDVVGDHDQRIAQRLRGEHHAGAFEPDLPRLGGVEAREIEEPRLDPRLEHGMTPQRLEIFFREVGHT